MTSYDVIPHHTCVAAICIHQFTYIEAQFTVAQQ